MFTKKEYYKHRPVKLNKKNRYMNIEFVTAYCFLGIPIIRIYSHVPNKAIDEDVPRIEPKVGPKKTGSVYKPSKDEEKQMSGEFESNFS